MRRLPTANRAIKCRQMEVDRQTPRGTPPTANRVSETFPHRQTFWALGKCPWANYRYQVLDR